MGTLRLLWLAIIILLPGSALAANIETLDGNTVVNDELAAFRYRENPGLWQRTAPIFSQITDLRVTTKAYLVGQAQGEYLLYGSADGLSYELVWSSLTPIQLVQSTKLLAVNSQKAVDLDDNTDLELDLPAVLTNPQSEITAIGEQVLVAVQRQDGIDLFDITQSSTLPKWSLNCATSYFVTAPAPVIGCNEKAYSVTDNGLTVVVDGGELISQSPRLLLWRLSTPEQYLIFDGTETVTLQFSDLQPTDWLEVVSDRLFLHQTTTLFEVAWQSSPINLTELPESGQLRQAHDLLVLEGGNVYYSRAFGTWQETNLDQGLSLIDGLTGIVAYLPLGSLTLSEQTPGTFLTMSDSWAASSKIKAVKKVAGRLLLVLRNSSNNPNLYQSQDNLSWQRITLPTKVTFGLSVNQARQMPAGSLVEIAGKISVLPGWVNDSIGYLGDDSGYIQFFLSSSRGDLLVDNYRSAVVIGEISSSQVGRVILDELNHLILGNIYKPSLSRKSIAIAKQSLGESVNVKAELTAVSQDSATLTDGSGSVKLHYDGIKDKASSGSVVELSLVFDLNSSTGQIESWYTGQTFKIVSVSSDQTEEPLVAKATRRVASTPKATSLIPAQPEPIVQSPSVAADVTTQDSLVASNQSKKAMPTWLTFLTGLIGGALTIRGRRFAKISVQI